MAGNDAAPEPGDSPLRLLADLLAAVEKGDQGANIILRLLVVEAFRRRKKLPPDLVKRILARQPTLTHDDFAHVPQ
jgi:hypothetical protein